MQVSVGVRRRSHGQKTRACQVARNGKESLMKRCKYTTQLPREMYKFFLEYEDDGAPSFPKFARRIGVTVEELGAFRSHKKFDRAYRECNEIRRDYLIDRALTKRFDPSFVKFLLSEGEDDAVDDGMLAVRLEVVDS